MAKQMSLHATLNEKFTLTAQLGEHRVYVDQGKTSGGDGMGPSPLEYLFVAIAGCVGTIARIMANQRKLPMRGMEIEVSGDYDPNVLLGRTKEGRAGFHQITVAVKLDADMTLEQKQAFLEEVDRRCPVSETVLNATPLRIRAVE